MCQLSFGERPALQQWNTHRFKITSVDDAHVTGQPLTGRRLRPALDQDTGSCASSGKRQEADCACRTNSRYGLHPIGKLLEEGDALGVFTIPRGGKLNPSADQFIRVEARIY